MKKVLIIQTAFIGDVILATSLLETLHNHSKSALKIDILVRKGNEGLLKGHPFINQVLIWNKNDGKYKSLLNLKKVLRREKYDTVYNLQRFGGTGWLTWRSGAKIKVGFKKNPFSFGFNRKYEHQIGSGMHEVERNFLLIKDDLPQGTAPEKPRLYPGKEEYDQVNKFISESSSYVVIAPSSVWFTKQLPFKKWCQLIKTFDHNYPIYMIGAPNDKEYLETIKQACKGNNLINLAGKLNLLESAALIQNSKRTYVNDSAPLHLASAMNAPVTAFFCSTVPSFGFGPLSDDARTIEVREKLNCRPCGLHGHKSCPEGHFNCGNLIDV